MPITANTGVSLWEIWPILQVGPALSQSGIADNCQNFQHQNCGIQNHTPGDFPQHRVHIPVNNQVPESIRAAYVHSQCQHCGGVSQKADKHRRSGQDFERLDAKQVNCYRKRERTGAQRNC